MANKCPAGRAGARAYFTAMLYRSACLLSLRDKNKKKTHTRNPPPCAYQRLRRRCRRLLAAIAITVPTTGVVVDNDAVAFAITATRCALVEEVAATARITTTATAPRIAAAAATTASITAAASCPLALSAILFVSARRVVVDGHAHPFCEHSMCAGAVCHTSAQALRSASGCAAAAADLLLVRRLPRPLTRARARGRWDRLSPSLSLPSFGGAVGFLACSDLSGPSCEVVRF
jgi:hypothetical protein